MPVSTPLSLACQRKSSYVCSDSLVRCAQASPPFLGSLCSGYVRVSQYCIVPSLQGWCGTLGSGGAVQLVEAFGTGASSAAGTTSDHLVDPCPGT